MQNKFIQSTDFVINQFPILQGRFAAGCCPGQKEGAGAPAMEIMSVIDSHILFKGDTFNQKNINLTCKKSMLKKW